MALITVASLVTTLGVIGITGTAASVIATVTVASMYVGLAGLALKIVGAVTGNKTISKIGTYMGYAGLVGGIVTLGASAGAYLMADPTVVGSIAGSGVNTADVPVGQVGADAANTATEQATKAMMTVPQSTGVQIVDPELGKFAQNPLWGATGQEVNAAVDPTIANRAGADLSGNLDPSAGTGPAQAPPGATASAGAQASQGVQPAPVTGSPAVAGDSSSINIRDPYGNYHTPASGLMGPQRGVSPGGEQSWADWWKKVDPSVKAMGGLAAGQTLAGAAQGWFAGQSAEEKLKLETLMNEQKQTELQRRIFNASFAPKVVKSSSTGMLQQGGA